jgi:hypothetical protein
MALAISAVNEHSPINVPDVPGFASPHKANWYDFLSAAIEDELDTVKLRQLHEPSCFVKLRPLNNPLYQEPLRETPGRDPCGEFVISVLRLRRPP